MVSQLWIVVGISSAENERTFFASLLYSSTNALRSSMSSASDIRPISPLVDVQVALLDTPLERLGSGKVNRPGAGETDENLDCCGCWRSSDDGAARDALIVFLERENKQHSEAMGINRQSANDKKET